VNKWQQHWAVAILTNSLESAAAGYVPALPVAVALLSNSLNTCQPILAAGSAAQFVAFCGEHHKHRNAAPSRLEKPATACGPFS
jgi:hypothetical protein